MDARGAEESDDFVNSLYKKVQNRIRMKDVAKEFLKSAEYSAARDILQQLLPMTEEHDARLDLLLQIAECDIMVTRRIVAKTDTEILSLLESCGKTGYEMREMADQRDDSAAVIAFLYACKLLKVNVEANKAVKDTESCIMRASHEIKQMSKRPESKACANKTSALMAEMVNQMKQIRGADFRLKVRSQATCLARIAYVLNKINKIRDAFELLKEGRELMTNELGDEAPQYHVYAALAHNMAATLARRGEFAEAASFHKKAIAEMEVAGDIAEGERREQLDNFRAGLDHEEHMASWLRARGLEGHSVVEMACNAAHEKADQMSGDQSTPSFGTFPDMAHLQNLLLRQKDEGQEDIPIEKAIREIVNQGVITERTDRQILAEFQRKDSSWETVRKMAKKRNGAGAVVLHLYTCKLLPFSEPPDTVVREVGECFKLSRITIEEMIKGSGIELGKKLATLLHAMLKELRAASNGREDLKVTVEANCLNKMGSVYIQLEEYTLAKRYLADGRTVMLSYFGTNASRHSVYASIANNIANAYGKLKDHAKSAEYYVKAFTDMQSADVATGTTKKEKLAAYAKGFETALAHTESTDPQNASKLRSELATHDIMKELKNRRVGSGHVRTSALISKTSESFTEGLSRKSDVGSIPGETQTQPRHMEEKTRNPKHPFVNVGNGIYANHREPLREGYLVFRGKLGGVDVAVKKIEFSDAHKREIEIMKNLEQHPNTVEYKASSEWESTETPGIKAIYLAMELCEKDTLYELARDESFTPQDRLSSLLQFTRGLCHIHRNNIIHGDLKPHNLLRSSDDGIVKVADFGISKKLKWDKTHVTLTTKQAGTYGWMAPDLKLTKKYDIYSAGLIYYYVLSGGKELCEETELADLECPDASIARELISRMIDFNFEKRPTAEECRGSPLFWDDEKKIHFICSLSDHFSGMPPNAAVLQQIEKCASDVVGDSWASRLQGEDSFPRRDVNETSLDDNVLQDMAMTSKYQHGSIGSLIRFIADCCHSIEENDTQLRAAFPTEGDVWRFFGSRFPRLISAAYSVAEKCGYFWPAEQKLQYLNNMSSPINYSELQSLAPIVFRDTWLENLILDKATVKRIRENTDDGGYHYKISKYSLYNKAVSNDRVEEGNYDEKSVQSLLNFMNNRQKYFKEDGKLAELIFDDNKNGIWEFFYGRFPNLLDDIVLCVSNPPQHLIEEQ